MFIYLAGTLMLFNGPEAKLITSEMAKRGFVAAAVDYDSFAYPYGPAMEAKAKCIFDAQTEASALLEQWLRFVVRELELHAAVGVWIARTEARSELELEAAQ